MSNFPWLTVAGVIPLVGAIAVGLTPGRSAPGSEADRKTRDLLVKRITLVFTLATLAVTIAMAVNFKIGGPRFQFTQTYQWIPQFGVHYAVGADGIALVLILMTTVLMPVVVLASWNDAEGLGNRRVLVLRVLRGDARPDVLHDRQLRRRPAAVRGGEVPALQPARRAADAGCRDRALRLLDARRPARHVRFQHAQFAESPRAEPDRAEVAVRWLLRRVRDQGTPVAVPHLAARRGDSRPARRGRGSRRRAR